MKNASAVPNAASITTIAQIGDRRRGRSAPPAARAARRATRSVATITRWRSSRSAHTPPISTNSDERDRVAPRARCRRRSACRCRSRTARARRTRSGRRACSPPGRQPQQPELAVAEDGAHVVHDVGRWTSTSSSTRGSARGPAATTRAFEPLCDPDVHYEDPLTPEPLEGARGDRRARAAPVDARSPTRACSAPASALTDGPYVAAPVQGARHPPARGRRPRRDRPLRDRARRPLLPSCARSGCCAIRAFFDLYGAAVAARRAPAAGHGGREGAADAARLRPAKLADLPRHFLTGAELIAPRARTRCSTARSR